MMKAIPLEEIGNRTMVPQAVIKRPMGEVARRFDARVVWGHDDLDNFEGFALLLNGTPVAIKHYPGYPDHTVTVYLPVDVHRLKKIHRMVARILVELQLSHSDLMWQRDGDEAAPMVQNPAHA